MSEAGPQVSSAAIISVADFLARRTSDIPDITHHLRCVGGYGL